jgi:uncharacterized NAD-dependent epimerase/dehydratase family protein
MDVLPDPWLAFLGDVTDPLDVKTARGVRDWAPERLVGQWRLPGCPLDLEVPELDPPAAVAAGAQALLIGVAPFGGRIPGHWIPSLEAALAAGLDLVSGLHQRLADVPELASAAAAHGRALHDVRHGGAAFRDVATGRRRRGKRLLTVGTDCALGKKYTALALHRALAARGVACDFRATGQTGVLIAGAGLALDAVVADFLAGAAESLSPDAAADHWDLIEGQGSLFHPAYAGVALGLLHGSQPDAIVLCHDPARAHVDGYPDHPIPDPVDAIDLTLRLARVTNPDAACLGIALNTSGLPEAERDAAIERTAAELALPCVDPMRTGVDALVDALLARG